MISSPWHIPGTVMVMTRRPSPKALMTGSGISLEPSSWLRVSFALRTQRAMFAAIPPSCIFAFGENHISFSRIFLGTFFYSPHYGHICFRSFELISQDPHLGNRSGFYENLQKLKQPLSLASRWARRDSNPHPCAGHDFESCAYDQFRHSPLHTTH